MPYIGKNPADIIATSVDTDTGTFSGNVTAGGTLGVTGAVTANAGVVVDNITIDGTEIDLSSGNLTLDVAGAILLDADVGNVQIHDAGTEIGRFANSSSDFVIKSAVSDKDMIFKGNDSGSEITALTLDMSDAGTAKFNHDIHIPNGGNIYLLASSGYSPIISNSSDTNSISFFTGNNQRMNIDGNGHITMPNQPAFFAEPSSTQSDIAINSLVQVAFGTERYDQNSDYNNSNSTFTAPVTGKYQFNLIIRLDNIDTASSYYFLRFTTSNRDHTFLWQPKYSSDPQYFSYTLASLADMDASDTCTVNIYQVGGTSQTDINNDSRFSGYLVA